MTTRTITVTHRPTVGVGRAVLGAGAVGAMFLAAAIAATSLAPQQAPAAGSGSLDSRLTDYGFRVKAIQARPLSDSRLDDLGLRMKAISGSAADARLTDYAFRLKALTGK